MKIGAVLLCLGFAALGSGKAFAQQPQSSPSPQPRVYRRPPAPKPAQTYKEPPPIFKEEIPPQPTRKQREEFYRRRRDYLEKRKFGPETNLALTHLLPSAFVIPGGTVVFGTTAGYGFRNWMDVTSNLYFDLEQVYNVSAKFSLIHGRNFAVAPWVSYISQSTNTNQLNPATGTLAITSMSSSAVEPGLTISYRLFRRLTAHTGGNFVFRTPDIPKESLSQRTALIQGTTVRQEFTIGFNEFAALSLGGSYDLTYDVWGAGASLHMGGFQLGAHYYLNVTEGAIQPIIGWGFVTSY